MSGSVPLLSTVEVHTGVEVATRAVERVTAAAARDVPGVARLEPTLAGTATGLGRHALDAASGRDPAYIDGLDVRASPAGVHVEVCLSVAGRAAGQVCAEVSRAVRVAVRGELGVAVASVRIVVVEVEPPNQDGQS